MTFSRPRFSPGLRCQKASKIALCRRQRYFLVVFLVQLLILHIVDVLRSFRPHASILPTTLTVPAANEGILSYASDYARKHTRPVYVLYKARSGQLNNQLISLFNALVLAKQANATLIAPFAFHGTESCLDFAINRSIFFHISEKFHLYLWQPFLKQIGLFYAHDDLVGDYFDTELLNKAQPVVPSKQFLQSPEADHLRSFKSVLVRKGDATFYYMALGRRRLYDRDVNVRQNVHGEGRGTGKVASRRELDCNFNISDYFRGLSYHAGVNGNYLFLSKLYRSHSLNCTNANRYWLDVRRFVQPRAEIRKLVQEVMQLWGNVLALHLRLFPFDLGKYSVGKFCDYFLKNTAHQEVEYVYIAYSVSSQPSTGIVNALRQKLGDGKVLTAANFGSLHSRGDAFNKRYSLPILDMWICVQSQHFVGRLGSSLSWNVVYWRQAFSKYQHHFYSLSDFAQHNERNPTDSYGF